MDVDLQDMHPPGAEPIQTEEPTVYASLDHQAMKAMKTKDEKKDSTPLNGKQNPVNENRDPNTKEERGSVSTEKQNPMYENRDLVTESGQTSHRSLMSDTRISIYHL